MGLVTLLFGFKGRINRLQYWLGSLGVGFAGALLIFMVGLAVTPQAGASKEAALAAAPMMLMMMGLVCLIMGWCGLAIQVKRFHDRNQPGWLSLLPVLPMMGIMTTLVSGVLAGHQAAQLGAALQPYMLVMWAINFFFFINLGCLGGTDGPNKYGPPPGSPPSARIDPSPSTRPQAQPAVSLGGVEAAMERAIAEKARAPVAPKPARAAVAVPVAAGASAGFGRRPAR